MAKKMYESPQAASDSMATPMGSDTQEGVKQGANDRSKKRHAVKSPSDSEADSLFPGAGSGEVLDKAGVANSGYIVKKNTPYGVGAMFNTLPPGMDIEDQEIADIREQPYREVTDLGYPGDGWK
jgi:hypothetical protein